MGFMNVLEAINLTRIYNNKVKALDNINLKVSSNLIFALLGRNGAGKTTFVRIMATQLLPTHGKGYVFGYDIVSEANMVRRKIAIVPQEARPVWNLTVYEHVYYYLIMRGVSRLDAKINALRTIDKLGLNEYKNMLAVKLSGGLKRRLFVAMCMATEADLVFLDEPTTGLDPIARRLVWRGIRDVIKEGRTILLTSHYMDEVEQVSDMVAVIDNGILKAIGTVEEIKSSTPYKAKVIIKGKLRERLGKTVEVADRTVVYVKGDREAGEVANIALKQGLEATTLPLNLEDAFIIITGEP